MVSPGLTVSSVAEDALSFWVMTWFWLAAQATSANTLSPSRESGSIRCNTMDLLVIYGVAYPSAFLLMVAWTLAGGFRNMCNTRLPRKCWYNQWFVFTGQRVQESDKVVFVIGGQGQGAYFRGHAGTLQASSLGIEVNNLLQSTFRAIVHIGCTAIHVA